MKKHGKVLSSRNDFFCCNKKIVLSISIHEKNIMYWKNFRRDKGQNIQIYTQEFRKRDLILDIHLSSQYTLLKCTGILHIYLRHTILMFNPTKLDEQCSSRGKKKIFQGWIQGKGEIQMKKKKNDSTKN